MPNYQFYNKDTNQIEEHFFSYKVLDEFKQNNPHLKQYFSADTLPVFSDGIRMNVPGAGKPDSTFEKYVIDRIKKTVPGNTLEKSHKTKAIREW